MECGWFTLTSLVVTPSPTPWSEADTAGSMTRTQSSWSPGVGTSGTLVTRVRLDSVLDMCHLLITISVLSPLSTSGNFIITLICNWPVSCDITLISGIMSTVSMNGWVLVLATSGSSVLMMWTCHHCRELCQNSMKMLKMLTGLIN